MSERIDHYAAAVEMLKDAQAAQDLSVVGIIAQGAQVHATLALVEQQRIANLIALGALDGMAGYDPHETLLVTRKPDDPVGAVRQLKPEIKEALGL